MQQYQVIVIGAGPAGYVCAIRCAQLGFKVACIDKWVNAKGKPALGGTCLNVGCIPSKALLDSTHHVHFLREHAGRHGLKISGLEVDIPTMQKRKDKVVQTLTRGVTSLLKKNKVDVLAGTARLLGGQQVHVEQLDGSSQKLQGEHIVIASGSKPSTLPGIDIDNDRVLDSTGALGLQEAPERLGIIGAGVIGLEMGSVWNRLGSEVIILEALPEFLPAADHTVSKEASRILAKQGLDIRLNCRVEEVQVSGGKVAVSYSLNGAGQLLEVSRLVVAVGRMANTEDLDLEAANVNTDQRGFIETDTRWQTSTENIYAIGDAVGGAMLAHKGSEEGMALAEQLADQHAHINYDVVPWVVYTWPEIAWVGQTEQQCKHNGIPCRTGEFPFRALGRAHAMDDTEGLFKIVCEQESDRILGAHILGPFASELICEAVVAMESELCAEDLARMVHAHPSLSEGMHEAALATDKRAIHF